MNRLLRLHAEATPSRSDASLDVHANLAGDYSYLSTGYYASLDAELEGLEVLPTTTEALDAYVVPIAMLKARAGGMPVPEFGIVTDRFPPPPLLAYPVNPFSSKAELLPDLGAIQSRRNGLTYTGKYAVLVQELPEDYRIDVVRCVLGRTPIGEYADFARTAYEVFRLPLMRVRVIVTARAYLFSAVEPLPYRQLTKDERSSMEASGTWRD